MSVVALAAARGLLTMQEHVSLRDLPSVGILLASSLTTGFDERVGALVPAWRRQAIALTPFVAILSNLSTRTVVAYCIAFESADEGGRSRQNLVHFNYPNAVAGTAPDQTGLPRGREVRPGEERVVGLRFEINPSVDNAWLDEFARQQGDLAKGLHSLTVEVDAAIFEDGLLVGRDTSGLQQAFEMYLQATQGLYQSVVRELNAGQTIDAIFASIRASMRQNREKSFNNPDDREAVYSVQAAGDALQARARIGDDKVKEVFERAIRPVPFTVRREAP
ncbi:MAG TPA: hypothetical protein VNT81_19110 [Vicinamibacterales bacterium]|nr:hypothetical protein [Vicinamibacterales bacterium]